MVYGVEHMVVAHLIHLPNAVVPKKGAGASAYILFTFALLSSFPAPVQAL